VEVKQRPTLTIAAILCATATGASYAQERPASKSVDSVVATLAGGLVGQGECIGIAVGTDHSGVQGFYAYGSVDHGTGRLPAPTTEFEIGSITKVFTTTLLALYTHRMVVKLDAPLQNCTARSHSAELFRSADYAGRFGNSHVRLAARAANSRR
jgi:CubicO group peptidase (beta-lactamase class C family)